MPVSRTYSAKPGDVEAKWWIVDGTDMIVGRLASDIAVVLMGKHRPTYTANIDTGDYVIVTNVELVAFTGKKWDQKKYIRIQLNSNLNQSNPIDSNQSN